MDNENKIVLSASKLCAGYSSNEIIHDISVSFECGKITVIAGENGSGKSTFLKSLVGIIPKTSGEITIFNKRLESYNTIGLAKQIAYLPQKKNIPELNVMTMVLHGRFAHLGFPRRYSKEDISAAREAMEITGITEYADEKISHLSGGTQQRVFLAMALAQNSPIILMDEPTSFLDISHKIKFMELCKALANQGKAVIMVLHDLPAAMKYADNLLLLSKGRTVSFGTPEAAFESGDINRTFNVNLKCVNTESGKVYYY